MQWIYYYCLSSCTVFMFLLVGSISSSRYIVWWWFLFSFHVSSYLLLKFFHSILSILSRVLLCHLRNRLLSSFVSQFLILSNSIYYPNVPICILEVISPMNLFYIIKFLNSTGLRYEYMYVSLFFENKWKRQNSVFLF